MGDSSGISGEEIITEINKQGMKEISLLQKKFEENKISNQRKSREFDESMESMEEYADADSLLADM